MKTLIKVILGIVVLLLITIIVAISVIDVNKYKDDVIALVEDNTGRDFDIAGEFSLGLSLIPTLILEGVTLGNAEWGTEKPMLNVGRIEVQIALLPLLRNTVQVNRLILDTPEILLETDKQGKGNWIFVADKAPADPGPAQSTDEATSLPKISLNEVAIDDAHLIYKDGITGKVTKLSLSEVKFAADNANDAIGLTVNATYNDVPLSIDGKMGTIDNLMENKTFPVQISSRFSEAHLNIDGQITSPQEAKGLDLAIMFQVESLHQLSKLAETELPAFGPIQLSGKLSDTNGAYHLKAMELKAGTIDITGDLNVITSGQHPALQAKLGSNLIDLTPFQSEAEQPEKEKEAKLFSSAPLPIDALNSVDVDIHADLKKILTKNATLDNFKLGIKLDRGKLVVKPVSMTLAGGNLNAAVTLDGQRDKSASLALDLNIKELQPGLLPDLNEKISGAITNLNMQARGSGKSVAEIMAGLNGNVLIQSGAGELKGKGTDAATSSIFLKMYRMMNPEAEDEGTQIECFVTKFDIKDGIAAIDKGIALATNKMNVIGSGTINFKTEELDIGVVPEAREGAGVSVGQLAELVRLKGTLNNPKIGTDTKAALKAGLSVGAAIATGGLSVLGQGLYDKRTADKDPCATALGIAPAETTTAKSEDTETPETESATDRVKKAGGAIKDKFKSLFGN